MTHAYVMYNGGYGSLSFSDAAMAEYRRQSHAQDVWKVRRNDQLMVAIVQKMGKRANGPGAKIQMRQIPIEFMDYREHKDP